MDIDDLERRAEAGSVVAKTILGVCYLDGVGVAVDVQRALELLTQAAEQGAPRAMVNLGRMYEDGLAAAPDVDRAAELYRRGGRSGEFLGWIYLARLQRAAGRVGDASVSYQEALRFADRVRECAELTEAREYAVKPSE